MCDDGAVPPRPTDIAKALEVMAIRPNLTVADIERLCAEARDAHVAAICVPPVHVARAAALVRGSDIKLVALVSFPAGADTTAVKAAACVAAAEDGADEVEVVMALSAFLSGDPNGVRDELQAIVHACQLRELRATGRALVVRAVIETGYLDDPRIRLAARVLRAAKVDVAVTSTGLAPKPASPLDVELLREELGSLPIKATGGVRTVDEVVALVRAGATRVGTSHLADLVR